MTPKTEEFKAAMSIVRERIAAAKRRGTHSGFIDYSGCISVTNEYISILEGAGKSAERGEFTFAYSVAALILVNLAKLAGSADDSAGGITDARNYVDDVLEKVCSGVSCSSTDAEFIFLQSIKDSQNKAFDGWDEFAYDLLLPTARLATEKNVDKLYTALNELSVKLSKKSYSSWYLECDCLVRLAAITVVDGDTAAERFIIGNLKYDGVRRIAIQRAVGKADYASSETLCLDKINAADRDYHWVQEWYDRLFDIYLKMGDKGKQSDLAMELLFNKRDTKYYDILKQLLIENGKWEAEYPYLLERLSQSLMYYELLSILSKENETRRMLAVLQSYPCSVFNYGKQMSAAFPQETYALCLDEIRRQAAEVHNRIEYKQVCAFVKKLYEFGGVAETQRIISEMISKYPHRPAMLEELNGLAVKMQNARTKRK